MSGGCIQSRLRDEVGTKSGLTLGVTVKDCQLEREAWVRKDTTALYVGASPLTVCSSLRR